MFVDLTDSFFASFLKNLFLLYVFFLLAFLYPLLLNLILFNSVYSHSSICVSLQSMQIALVGVPGQVTYHQNVVSFFRTRPVPVRHSFCQSLFQVFFVMYPLVFEETPFTELWTHKEQCGYWFIVVKFQPMILF